MSTIARKPAPQFAAPDHALLDQRDTDPLGELLRDVCWPESAPQTDGGRPFFGQGYDERGRPDVAPSVDGERSDALDPSNGVLIFWAESVLQSDAVVVRRDSDTVQATKGHQSIAQREGTEKHDEGERSPPRRDSGEHGHHNGEPCEFAATTCCANQPARLERPQQLDIRGRHVAIVSRNRRERIASPAPTGSCVDASRPKESEPRAIQLPGADAM